MVITVYDWANKPKFIDVPVESAEGIASIDIQIISGDETGVIMLKDGTEISFDASDDRVRNYYDGEYTLTSAEDIAKWNSYTEKDSHSRTISYNRHWAFGPDEDTSD